MELKLQHAQELESFYKNKWKIAEGKLTEIQANKQVHFSHSNSNLRFVLVIPHNENKIYKQIFMFVLVPVW